MNPLSSDPKSPDYWGPGCKPRWFITSELRQIERDDRLILQQKRILTAYAEWPPDAEEWMDVPTESTADKGTER